MDKTFIPIEISPDDLLKVAKGEDVTIVPSPGEGMVLDLVEIDDKICATPVSIN